MSQQKEIRRIIPVDPEETDIEQLKWFTRESFELTATADHCRIVDYTTSVLDPSEISPQVAENLPHPIEHYQWWCFTAVIELADREPLPQICGYCRHDPHKSGKCSWENPETGDGCICLGDTA